MTTRRNDSLAFRLSSKDRRTVERAARIEKQTLSEFVLSAALNRAVETIDAMESNRREAEA